jgi:hypothetical protein
MIHFEPILVLAILAKICGLHSMGCAFWPKLRIQVHMILECLLFIDGFIKIVLCKMLVDE